MIRARSGGGWPADDATPPAYNTGWPAYIVQDYRRSIILRDHPCIYVCSRERIGVDSDTPVEDILDTIGDNHARRILVTVSRTPRSAKEIAEECDISLPTVYRRLELLEANNLVEDSQEVDDDGNEFRIYKCAFDSTIISLKDDKYDVRIYRTENLPDRFSRLWDDLQS